MAKQDFIQHVLGGVSNFGKIRALVIPGGTVLLELKKFGGQVKAIPHVTKKDLQVSIREHFIEKIDWEELDAPEEAPQPAQEPQDRQ